MNILDELESIACAVGGESDTFKRVSGIVVRLMASLKAAERERDELRTLAMPIPKQEPAGAVPELRKCCGNPVMDNGYVCCGEYLYGDDSADQDVKLDKPAMVFATTFGTGVSARLVVEAAQRYYEYRQEHPAEKDDEFRNRFFNAIDKVKSPRITEQDAREKEFLSLLKDVADDDHGLYVMGSDWHDRYAALLNKLNANAVAEVRKEPVITEEIKNVLRLAVQVVDYRAGDVDTEDGSYATTDTSAIINLESALCEALGTKYDDIDLDEALDLIDGLPTVPAQAAAIPTGWNDDWKKIT